MSDIASHRESNGARSAQDERYARYPSLAGRAVLITGGATGIGASFVEHFARSPRGLPTPRTNRCSSRAT